jgi:hypothetical protein
VLPKANFLTSNIKKVEWEFWMGVYIKRALARDFSKKRGFLVLK